VILVKGLILIIIPDNDFDELYMCIIYMCNVVNLCVKMSGLAYIT
jgi:hypothetical protein